MLGVVDEILGEFFLLADGPFDGPHPAADFHLPFDSPLVFGFEETHDVPSE
jgi:hypothetical protein